MRKPRGCFLSSEGCGKMASIVSQDVGLQEAGRDVHAAQFWPELRLCTDWPSHGRLPRGLGLLQTPAGVCVSRPGCCRPPQASGVLPAAHSHWPF